MKDVKHRGDQVCDIWELTLCTIFATILYLKTILN